MLADVLFYVFSGFLLLAAALVVTARNPVHAVLFLIFGFFNAAGLFLLIGAEFLAMLLVVVYVGAVMVLFLFVVMMLDVKFEKLAAGAGRFRMLGSLLGLVLLVELIAVSYSFYSHDPVNPAGGDFANAWQVTENGDNIGQIGAVLYTDYVLLFQGAGLILLVAMMGAIVLTLRQREGVKRQKISGQLARDPKKEIRLVSGK